MLLEFYSPTVNSNKLRTFVSILISIINYRYYQAEAICSGAVESTIKQIDRRTKLSEAQWKEENVPQVHSESLCLPESANLCCMNKKWDAPHAPLQPLLHYWFSSRL